MPFLHRCDHYLQFPGLIMDLSQQQASYRISTVMNHFHQTGMSVHYRFNPVLVDQGFFRVDIQRIFGHSYVGIDHDQGNPHKKHDNIGQGYLLLPASLKGIDHIEWDKSNNKES